METSEKTRIDFMCHEYQNLPVLIAFFGSLQWQKGQWFFAVESVQLGGFGIAFKSMFLSGIAPTIQAVLLLVAACVFNFWICYVWFRTNRTNREYLAPLLKRASEIEAAILDSDKGTFSAQKRFLDLPEHVRHSSARWEVHLPSGFALAWSAALLTAAQYGGHLCLARCTLTLSAATLLMIERFHPKRQG